MENKFNFFVRLFYQFATLMIGIFILELAGGIAGYMLSSKAEAVLHENMIKMLPEYNKTAGSWSKQDWDNLQSSVSCSLCDKTSFQPSCHANFFSVERKNWQTCKTVSFQFCTDILQLRSTSHKIN